MILLITVFVMSANADIKWDKGFGWAISKPITEVGGINEYEGDDYWWYNNIYLGLNINLGTKTSGFSGEIGTYAWRTDKSEGILYTSINWFYPFFWRYGLHGDNDNLEISFGIKLRFNDKEKE